MFTFGGEATSCHSFSDKSRDSHQASAERGTDDFSSKFVNIVEHLALKYADRNIESW